jgi:adenosylhomocysteinase
MDGELPTAIAARYAPAEFPALYAQARSWRQSRPLAGQRVLDATPVFANTLPKYYALLAGGAEVVVGAGHGIPGDPTVVAQLESFGISLAADDAPSGEFDVVLDCAGAHADVPSRTGYAELTRSGLIRYRNCARPVVMVDSGELKRIETTLGTGDGFVRAVAHLGHPVAAGHEVVVLGGGKVGYGVAAVCLAAGAAVTVIDPLPVAIPTGAARVAAADHAAVRSALASAWCVVSATGRRHGLTDLAGILATSPALLANMGAEDEFGPQLPAERVLNAKVPVNFVLAEPTRLRYLDPTMALSNAAAVALVEGRVDPGPQAPSHEVEQEILHVVRETGAVADELRILDDAPRPGGEVLR